MKEGRFIVGFVITVLIGLGICFALLIFYTNKHSKGFKTLGKLVEFTYRPGL